MSIIFYCFGLFLIIQNAYCKTQMKLVYEWKELEFGFPSEYAKQRAIETQEYVKGNSIPIDMDVHYKRGSMNRVFITIPRFFIGRPYTLGVLTPDRGEGGPIIVPYPDASWHDTQRTDCGGITSVFRIAIDPCQRLWILDTGKIDDDSKCPPQILVFDLESDQLIHRHRIEPSSFKNDSLLITLILDVRDPTEGCRDTFAYIADVTGFGMIVYDYSRDLTWRVENKLFFPYPSYGTHTIAGESFELMDGLFGMSLSPYKNPGEDRTLYFHALASVTENSVKTSVLRNQTAWLENNVTPVNPRQFKVFKGTRTSQATAQAMDKNGVLYFGLESQIAIGCWDSLTDYSEKNIDIVAQDSESLQFASGLKVITNLKGQEEVWVLTCRFQKVMTGSLNSNEVNFRILAAGTKDLLWGSKCDHHPKGQAGDQNAGNFVGRQRSEG